jgi:hypothetical protein
MSVKPALPVATRLLQVEVVIPGSGEEDLDTRPVLVRCFGPPAVLLRGCVGVRGR